MYNENTASENPMTIRRAVYVVLLSMISAPISLFAFSSVAVVLWSWFITPLFNVPTPTLLGAYGLRLVFLIFTKQVSVEEWRKRNLNRDFETMKSDLLTAIKLSIAGPLMLLSLGWLVHHFAHHLTR